MVISKKVSRGVVCNGSIRSFKCNWRVENGMFSDKIKNDDWQEYAAIVAACYTKDLIENLPSF